MEKHITLQPQRPTLGMQRLANAAKTLLAPVEWLRKYYSAVLKCNVSMCQTMHLLHAQTAFAAAAFACGCSLLTHLLLAVWAVAAIAKCRLALSDKN